MKKQQKRDAKRAKREARKASQKEAKSSRKEAKLKAKEARHKAQREAAQNSTAIPVKKRKQHYVWQHYMSAWANDGQLWCQMDGRRFQSGTNGVANSRDFYRLKEMTPEDLSIVDLLVVQKSAPHLRELHHGWIPLFNEIFDLKKAYEASGQKNEEIEQRLDVAVNNIEEDLHAHIEQEAIPLLKLLVDGAKQAFTDPRKFEGVAAFIAFQYMRTPKIMRASIEAAASVAALKFNVEAAWGLMRTMYATNIGAALIQRRGTLHATFLESHPNVEFITGDQPAVNLSAHGLGPQEEATELVLYFPVSPRRAVLLSFDAATITVDRRTLSESETLGYNRMLFEMSDKQVFARRQEELIAASGATGASGPSVPTLAGS